jgi:hypothetical protein
VTTNTHIEIGAWKHVDWNCRLFCYAILVHSRITNSHHFVTMSHVDVQSGQKSKVKNVKNQELLRIENKRSQQMLSMSKPYLQTLSLQRSIAV